VNRRRAALAIAALVVVAGMYWLTASPAPRGSMRQFDPSRLAHLETRMWQAYYQKQNVRLFSLLVVMLREQYHYSWAVSVREAFHLARAAATFGSARSNYEQVLPDLETAYTMVRDWEGARFDPGAVARAELAWWVARRIPGENAPEHVGTLIADEYALLYEVPKPEVESAGVFRARAGALRDAEARAPDWAVIEGLLVQSYSDLHQALNPPETR
jgi:hypothetical protein